MKRFVGLALAAVALAGCETMTPDQCRLADWRALGYQDGAAGEPATMLERRQNSCAKAGVLVDNVSYLDGRREGLRAHCTPGTAFQVGLRGGSSVSDCPAELQDGYLAAFFAGTTAHRARAEVSAAESRLSSLRYDRSELDEDISDKERELSAAQDDATRNRLRDELSRLRERRARVDGELIGQERVLRLANEQLARVRAEIGARYGSW